MSKSNSMFSKKNLPNILRWVGTLLALVLLIYLLRQQGWAEIIYAFRQVPLWRFILALGLTFISRFAVTGRWHVLLRSAEIKIPFRQTLQITFAGLFASNFLPTTIGGDVVRLGGVIRFGYDRAISLASLVVDRLVGMAGMGMAALTLIFSLPELFHALKFSLSASIVVMQTGWWYKAKERLKGAFMQIFDALRLWLSQPKSILGALAFTWIHMLCVFGSIWILLPGLGETMSFWRIAGLWALTYFVTLLPISVNGLGVQELSLTFFFTTFGRISTANALTIAIFMRILPMFASLPGAFFIPGMLAGDKK
jgi:glycosyltransferase 2 family protein